MFEDDGKPMRRAKAGRPRKTVQDTPPRTPLPRRKKLDTSFGASPLTSSGGALCFHFGGKVWWKGQVVKVEYKGGKRPWSMIVGNIPSERAVVFNLSRNKRILLMIEDIVSIREA